MDRPTSKPVAGAVAPEAAHAPTEMTRQFVNLSLASAQDGVAWLQQWQKLNLQAIELAAGQLSDAIHEARTAASVQDIWSAVLNLAGRQWAQGFNQLSAQAAQWTESEFQFADRLRTEAVECAQEALVDGDSAPRAGAAAADLPWEPLMRLQDRWLAATQALVDRANAAAKAS